jgi:carboxymethylenebutenolidase
MDAYGLRPQIERMADRIAARGLVVLAPNDFYRAGRAPVAVTGYCMGGRVAWRIAAGYPERVAALAGFHVGGLVTDAEDSPHRSASGLAAEVYLGHADNDRSMTPDQIAELERALDAAGARYRSEVYRGAAHGYTMADTPAYDEAAAQRHYDELFALLERTIVHSS